ncbi:hypothetical protein PR202_gb18893 [Eleusine coracana subsp. coracana]|uniref:Uncharacterized protein n=1 Tax=Eleusine coracana subsp. coracana TaxID=191504 RepID=A0AAV5F4L5_ELECO|nr:hypothetical protein QOZ80_3BG0290770 [Eleusine coracana subsp. coracana]GJN30579.1 hypothetical protein PR202_gb18893 [Eleusine coracana subsp. coracana]
MDRQLLFMPPNDHLSTGSFITLCVLFLTSAVLVALGLRRRSRSGGRGQQSSSSRRGLSVQVTDRAVAHRALVQHSAAFLDRPTGAVPSTILTRSRHHNIHSAPYGPYWRAVRRNVSAVALHPSRLRLLRGARARVLGDLVRELRAGSGAAPASETLHFAVYHVLAEMCFGRDVVAEVIGEARLRAMHGFQREILLALPSFGVLLKYPMVLGKLLYPSRWKQLVALRRHQEETFLPLVAEVARKRRRKVDDSDDLLFKSYVESLLDVRVHEEDGDSRAVTDGELVSLISEFLGTGTESTATALEWTMARLIKHPEVQQKLRDEVDSIIASSPGAGGGGVVQEEDLPRMPYLRAVVLESLRRHPPVPFVLRHVEGGHEDDDAARVLGVPRLPDHGGGATVNFRVGKINRDPAAWSDPDAFKPERFMPGGEAETVDLTCTRELRMMPFGAGRRVCPGIATAMLHLEYLVANLVREFEWKEPHGEEEVDLTESRGFFMTVMKRPLRAKVVPRNAAQ